MIIIRHASSIILTRGTDASTQVFLVQCNPELRFMGGYSVFPVGTVTKEDYMAGTDKGEHSVRYYGWYTNRGRGMRKQYEENDQTEIIVNEAPVDLEFSLTAKAAWACLIQKVYEVDPMLCPHWTPARPGPAR